MLLSFRGFKFLQLHVLLCGCRKQKTQKRKFAANIEKCLFVCPDFKICPILDFYSNLKKLMLPNTQHATHQQVHLRAYKGVCL